MRQLRRASMKTMMMHPRAVRFSLLKPRIAATSIYYMLKRQHKE
jgi:hypothetical protein